MKQKVITLTVCAGIDYCEHPKIDKLLNDGWIIKQVSTAYTSKPGHSEEFIAVTFLLEHHGKD